VWGQNVDGGRNEESACVRAQADERFDAAEQYEKLGRQDAADGLRREAEVLLMYLPAAD
jgi:uncharacterized protein YqeY